MTVTEENEIIRLLKEGELTMMEISEKMKIGLSTIKRVRGKMLALGFEPKKGGRKEKTRFQTMTKEERAVQYARMQLLRRDGMSVEEIARKFHVSYSAVLTHTAAPDDKRPDIRRSIKMYQDGMSVGAIARELKRASNTIYDYLEKSGVEFRAKGVFADPTGGIHRGKIKALYRAGWSTKDIASDTGGSQKWVERVVEDIKQKEGLWGDLR